MIKKRSPIVSIIGGVNNGKTTFLRKILKKKFLEYDNITQKIRTIKYNFLEENYIFIDTPGHYLFSFIIKKIIKISDITIFVLDIRNLNKNEKIFIKYISKIKKPVIFLINKIDLVHLKSEEKLKIENIEKELFKLGILLEKSGGESLICKTSLVKNIGINETLKNISLLAYINEIKNDKSKEYFGYILESSHSKYLKFVLKGILKNGFLKKGDKIFLTETNSNISVKKIYNFDNKKIIDSVSPSGIFMIYGHKSKVGEKFLINKKKETILKKKEKNNEKKNVIHKDIFVFKKKTLIFKSNCNFKLFAIKEIYKSEAIKSTFKFIFLDIGLIKESDIKLANYLNSKIIYYIDIKNKIKNKKNIIVFNNIHNILNYLEKKIKKETFKIKVLKIFKIKKENFAGCKISGELKLNSKLIIERKNNFYMSKVSKIILNKIIVNKIKDKNFCLLLKNFDLKIGDLLYSLNNNEYLKKQENKYI